MKRVKLACLLIDQGMKVGLRQFGLFVSGETYLRAPSLTGPVMSSLKILLLFDLTNKTADGISTNKFNGFVYFKNSNNKKPLNLFRVKNSTDCP